MKKFWLTKRLASLDNVLVNVDLIDATHEPQRGDSKLPRKGNETLAA